jgi:hypothetical protein
LAFGKKLINYLLNKNEKCQQLTANSRKPNEVIKGEPMLRLKIIACDVLNREISYLASQSGCITDVTFLHQGLHETPDKLRAALQQEIERANRGFPYNHANTAPHFDYILLGYGLCSGGVTGVSSSGIPLVVPRAHDCATLLLGSKEKYAACFQNHPGTYWFSSGWIERSWPPGELKYQVLYRDYLRKYGEDNAAYLMETEQSWMKEYRNAALIRWNCIGNSACYREFTQKSAAFLGWNYLEYEGDPGLLQRMVNGEFSDRELLLAPAGMKIAPSFDGDIIRAES